MKVNILDIINSWITSFNPTKEQVERAEYRAAVCDACPYKEELNSSILASLTENDKILNKFKCGRCGCVLSKKIFSQFKEGCPENKWLK